ncbi:MAG: hypothetical protein M3R69_05150 [Acidobacteriota bacterium]|nr:hypothetical protein [Acidobacteriota bacterium]
MNLTNAFDSSYCLGKLRIALFVTALVILIGTTGFLTGCNRQPKEFPNQSDPGKCLLRVTQDGKLYCERQEGCRGQCTLHSVPNDKPHGEDEGKNEGDHQDKEHALTPDKNKYYYCRCLEL